MMVEMIYISSLVLAIGMARFAFSVVDKKEEKERSENKRFESYGKELEKTHRGEVAEIAMIRINQEMRNLEKRKESVDEDWKMMINEKIRKSKPIMQKYNELSFEKRIQIEDEIKDMLVHILQEIEKEKKESNEELKERFSKKIKEVTGTN